MVPDQYDADINIEGFLIWKIKIADQSFGMDILGTVTDNNKLTITGV